MSAELKAGTYQPQSYYCFTVTDPKERVIQALHFRDRVVQHCLCDEILSKLIEPKLIYDNAACRVGKGTHFAMNRLSSFMREHYQKYGCQGYFLKYDIRKYFDSIDHEVLKQRLVGLKMETELLLFLYRIIDGYETAPGKGLPLGNQSSQWFALYYLDGMDRLIKEKLRIHGYTRYMDDGVMIHPDREYLRECLTQMREKAEEIKLELNEKTQITPISCGVGFLGFHFYLTDTGKVIRILRPQAKRRYRHRLHTMQ